MIEWSHETQRYINEYNFAILHLDFVLLFFHPELFFEHVEIAERSYKWVGHNVRHLYSTEVW